MAWTYHPNVYGGGDSGYEMRGGWYDDETGNWTDIDPTPSGQYKLQTLVNEGATQQQLVDAVTGRVASSEEATQWGNEERRKFDASLPDLSRLPPERQWYYTERLPVQTVKRMGELGKFSPEFFSSLGPWIAARQAEADDRSGFDSHIMDSINTEKIHFENVGESWQKDPERAFLGINTPLEAEIWGAITGKEYDANTNMYGGPTKADYRESAARGNDPRFAQASHNATEGILGGFFGAKLGQTQFGQTGAGKASIGAGRGAFNAYNTDSNPYQGALMGAANAYARSGGGTGSTYSDGQGDLVGSGGDDVLEGEGNMDDYGFEGLDDSYWDYGMDFDSYYGGGEFADETGAFDQFGWASDPSNPEGGSILDGWSGSGFNLGSLASGALGLGKNLLSGGNVARLLGALGPAALGAYASNKQSQNMAELGDKYLALGAPSRARYEASYLPGFSMANDPGYTDALNQTVKGTLHGLSVTGNPADSPNAWTQTLSDVNSKFAYPALQDFRRTNAGAGGLATLAGAAPGLESSAINAKRGVYDSIGAGMADIFTPKQSLADLLRGMR